MFVKLREIIYGGWIYLDDVAEQLSEDVQYKQASFSYAADAAEPPDKDVIAISLPLKKGKAFLNGSLSRSEILGGISVFYMVLRAGTFIALLLIPVLYLVISNLLLNPLRLVNQAHKRLQEGDLDYRIQEKANSIEYSYSFLSFNQMADQIKTLKIENYEKELDRQKMELKNLQLQIHPHFLLNTFNLVYTLAQRKETGAIQDIVIYLSEYFRYIFRSGKSL